MSGASPKSHGTEQMAATPHAPTPSQAPHVVPEFQLSSTATAELDSLAEKQHPSVRMTKITARTTAGESAWAARDDIQTILAFMQGRYPIWGTDTSLRAIDKAFDSLRLDGKGLSGIDASEVRRLLRRRGSIERALFNFRSSRAQGRLKATRRCFHK
uniref:Uncharacterized protein n=1 Tax=Lotharella globosa TaxID=91324 RepID=A0A7S3Z9M6_9EUKA|mmetsp:Transcript_4862/g.9532  ORF Transcript_4862/g.9532 Transcript_4862/m.9532 type:complete len:157 (+) Transcript_4862:3-473(+)